MLGYPLTLCYIFLGLTFVFSKQDRNELFPYVVGIIRTPKCYRNPENCSFEYVCTGTILTDHFVVTVAHCLKKVSNGPSKYTYYIVYNSTNFTVSHLPVRNIKEVSDVYLHPKYIRNDVCSDYDIALLQLEDPIYHTYVNIFQSNSSVDAGIIVKFQTVDNEVFNLESLPIDIYTETTCKVVDDKKHYIYKNICGGRYDNDSVSLRVGNSGSPLLILKDNGDCLLLGILYCGFIAFANETHPAAFIKILPYIDWIKSVIYGSPEENLITKETIKTTTIQNDIFSNNTQPDIRRFPKLLLLSILVYFSVLFQTNL